MPDVDHQVIGKGQKIADLNRAKVARFRGVRIPTGLHRPGHRQPSFRGTDKRGGANGARICLAPQKDWEVNNPAELAAVLSNAGTDPDRVQQRSQGQGGKRVSLADPDCTRRMRGRGAGRKERRIMTCRYPFKPGRTDASQEWTDVESFAVLEPDRRRVPQLPEGGARGHSAEELLVEQAFMLDPYPLPEMTALIGGMRVLNANTGQSQHGVLTDRPEALTNDFFVNLLDMNTEWTASAASGDVFEGRDSETGEIKWTGTGVDLVFGSNSELRAIAEVYGCDDAHDVFVRDFVSAWRKVMELDRYDLR